jgi:acyl-coenzyme A thioesterase PaaI-like protein
MNRGFPTYPACPVCGDPNINPASLAVRWHWDDARALVVGSFTPTATHAGYSGRMHGGLLSTLLDEGLAWACALTTRSYCMTGDLRVRFKHSARLGETLEITGAAGTVWGRYVKAQGEVRTGGGELIATAVGSFAALPHGECLAMRSALVFRDGDIDVLE